MSHKTYIKMDQRTHILARPDMYVGSIRPVLSQEYVPIIVSDSIKMVKQGITCPPALLRIFVEVISNAIDNVHRSRHDKIAVSSIKVTINEHTGETTVWNDGDIIPIELNKEHSCYNHSMIFGQLLTSSNYNDESIRTWSGKNGVGAKNTNVFSTYFRVIGFDPSRNIKLTQIWRNNMSVESAPILEQQNGTGFTEISYIPDFSQFEMTGYTPEIILLYKRYIYDMAMLTGVDVYINNSLLPINSLLLYSQLYAPNPVTDIIQIQCEGNSVVVFPSNECTVISFVNGVFTSQGGVHVDAWIEALFRPFVEKYNKPSKPQITIKEVKQFFNVFINCTVSNPEFSSQSKSELTNPTIVPIVQRKHILAMTKWSIINEKINELLQGKELLMLKKTERKKKGFVKVDGLETANNAGTKLSDQCVLILCEGLSAKTYAVSGIDIGIGEKQGRDWFGIYPLRGKILNVRRSKPTDISKNKEITDIIQSLGLRYGVDYRDDENYKQLSYGKVLMMTDQDVDGIHISGLLLNFFHTLFPTLLQRPTPFIESMYTPIVRVFLKPLDILFYDENTFKEYVERMKHSGVTIKKKYYKGLGTSTDDEIVDTFGKKIVSYIMDEQTDSNMNKVFHMSYADERKLWVSSHVVSSTTFGADSHIEMPISQFLNREMIKFSIDDCKRSIPHLVDGLKESQRKILYSCFLKNLKYSGQPLKVAQLSGFVAEKSNYHHGEQNLYDTITKMANEFTGSNNIPLLFRNGQFGSRAHGGKDAANARYIFTKVDKLTRLLYRPEDDVLLSHIEDDGDTIEPQFYVPIIPMILVNGVTAGIGTGWSCSIPCFNPNEIIEGVRLWIQNRSPVLLPQFTPWYRGFEGVIEKISEHKFITYGVITKEKKKTIVSELPVGMWTEKFNSMMDTFLEEKSIKSVKNYSTKHKINYHIIESPDGLACSLETLKLHSYIFTSNMVLFLNGKITKFNSVHDIIDAFCIVRFNYYEKRKVHTLTTLEYTRQILTNKIRFIQMVIDDTIVLKKKTELTIINELTEHGFIKDDSSYNYLLRMQIRSFTSDKIEQLEFEHTNIVRSIEIAQSTSPEQVWLQELTELQEAYGPFERSFK